MRRITYLVVAFLVVAIATTASDPRIIMKTEVTGLETNCYLIYDSESRDAALIDVGGPIDILLSHIREQDLRVRYLLITHGHPDHVIGLANLRHRFPEARLCMHKADFEAMQTVQQWLIDAVGPVTDADRAANPEMAKLLAFDVRSIRKPEIFVRDSQTLMLGSLPVEVIHSPGHSPGSVCYLVGDMLFSGDVLFRRSVGRVDLPNSSADDQISSVRRLYTQLPESTRVYPGHGESTDIGSEKYENTEITMHKAEP